uniref:Uncharacterized protein n=1 Tax=viral metagenome TaxID=1070528 RepID=A0A6C0EYN4_9ZZZZ
MAIKKSRSSRKSSKSGKSGKSRKSTKYDNKKKKKVVLDIFSSGEGEGEDNNRYDDNKKKKKKIINILDSGFTIPQNAYDDIKNNDNVMINLDKKKKRILDVANVKSYDKLDDDIKKRLELDSMKKTLCDIRYGNFLDIDVSDRTIYWGLGIEHEMQLFHKSSSGMKNTNILFDSQESTCFLIGDKQACCKLTAKGEDPDKCRSYSKEMENTNIKKYGLTQEEIMYLKNMQWELTGRQIKGCEPNKVVELIKRVPILMPELITTNFSNRSIDSIWKEMIKLEEHYISIHMKNPHTKEKVKQYGPLTTHLCSSHSEIQIPIRPTIDNPNYIFNSKPRTDYVGSYHMTITLPHTRDINIKDFIKMHQNMAQQIQWLEPLMMTAFFSSTQEAVGNHNEPEGSFRVMTIGWGNFGGSDVRKMGTTGLDRGSNIRSLWRNGLNFRRTKRLNYCARVSKPQYRKSKYIHTGDFRTFGVEKDFEKCERLYNPNDCLNGRADGAPMKPPFGMEIRIFDHFPSEYLLDLMRIITLIGCNAQRHPPKDHVYRDKKWIKAVQEIMKDGWNAIVNIKFIEALRFNLGLPINSNSTIAYDIFKQIVHELFEINKNEFINKIMNEHPEIEPVVPEINRMCWEMGFTRKFGIQVINFLKHSFHNNEELTVEEFKKKFKESGALEYSNWENEMNDLLYALETKGYVHLETFNGKIKSIKIKL